MDLNRCLRQVIEADLRGAPHKVKALARPFPKYSMISGVEWEWYGLLFQHRQKNMLRGEATTIFASSYVFNFLGTSTGSGFFNCLLEKSQRARANKAFVKDGKPIPRPTCPKRSRHQTIEPLQHDAETMLANMGKSSDI